MRKFVIEYINNDWSSNYLHQLVFKINGTLYSDFIYQVKDIASSYFEVTKGGTTLVTVTRIKDRLDSVILSSGLSSKVSIVQLSTTLEITIGEPGDVVEMGYFFLATTNGIVEIPGGYGLSGTGGTYAQANVSVEAVGGGTGAPELPIGNITAISTEEQITFCNSPINLLFQQANIKRVNLYLWIWNGALQQTLVDPNHTFTKDKVSVSDNYIFFEISQFLKSFLIAPPNAPDTSQPNFVYNELDTPTITGQAIFWQIVADVTDTDGVTTRYNYNTNVATLGYKWNYEQTLFAPTNIEAGGSLGFSVDRNKYYNPRIHDYISQAFDLTQAVETCTTGNVIERTDITPDTEWLRCSLEPILIVYLNKIGLFEMFTTHGKVVANTKIDGETAPRLYRNPATVDNSFMHSKLRDNLQANQTYTINTGYLKPEMVEQVEEILLSPKVYLIRFKGDLHITTTSGITIDNTYITIDDLNTTIDGLSVTNENLAKFKTHQQIPVIVTNSDFVRKTRLNDKKDIDFNITFEETNNKVNDIR